MDIQDPHRPHYQFTRGLIGLDDEKDAMTSGCLDRKEVRCATWSALTGFAYWPLDRVLTYKNLIYLLNLQVCSTEMLSWDNHQACLKCSNEKKRVKISV